MINVGDVFSWDNFQFPDGGSADKLFITLGSVGNNLLALKTTSKKHNKIDKAGCYTASKDGFQTQTSVIDWHVSGWYWAGNIVLGGLIGYLIIDPITGDMYYLDEEVNLNMSPVQ